MSKNTKKLSSLINKERLIDNFCQLTKISSPSGYENEISEFVINKFQKLNAKIIKDAYGNLIITIKGTGTPLMLCAHMDTDSRSIQEKIKPIINQEKKLSHPMEQLSWEQIIKNH